MTYEEYYKKYKDFYSGELNEKIAQSNEQFENEKKQQTAAAENQVKAAKDSYAEQLRENAIQKMINKRQISEDMANLGLSDSGTKEAKLKNAQTGYAAQRDKLIDTQNNSVKNIKNTLTATLSSLDNKKIAAADKLTQQYDKLAANAANKEYNAYIKLLKAQNKASGSSGKSTKKTKKDDAIISSNRDTLSRNYVGTLKDNGIWTVENIDGTVTYVDINKNISKTFTKGVNPYTNTVNEDIKYGAFSNGYQPDNVGGIKLEAVDRAYYKNTGVVQKIWRARVGDVKSFYMWDGATNRYVRVAYLDNKWRLI